MALKAAGASEDMETEEKPRICQGGRGIAFPLFGTEHQWDGFIQFTVYLIGLLWCFIGVSIISEIFMTAIEKITSQKRQVVDKATGKKFTVKIWNATVANLTLMALGSSAPEILLNVIGIFGDRFYAGDLGPSTIVGSAAFNLLIISAVCILAIPAGEPPRKIKDIKVFLVTGSFSLFAYVWLLVILVYSSRDEVESWESTLTFIFFWVLILVAYMADRGYFGEQQQTKRKITLWTDLSNEQLAKMVANARKDQAKDSLSDNQILEILRYQHEEEVGKSRAAYRAAATKRMVGAKQAQKSIPPAHVTEAFEMGLSRKSALDRAALDIADDRLSCRVQWRSLRFAVLGSSQDASICLSRIGDASTDIEVVYTYGVIGDDQQLTQAVATMHAGEQETQVVIHVGDLPDKELQLDIVQAKCKNDAVHVRIGQNCTCHLVVLGEGLPGALAFETEEVIVEESVDVVSVELKVHRTVGDAGNISCSYSTEDGSAIAGADYIATSGTLEFQPGEHEKTIKVDILPKGKFEGTERLRVVLTDAKGGAGFDPNCDGGPECSICTVVIAANGAARALDRIMQKVNWDAMASGREKWIGQFREAVYCNGSLEGQREATHVDWVMHVVSFPWKIFFACCPPADYCHGWLCFWVSLTMIGILTAMIGDLAQLLGCSVDTSDAITAITLVAMGTSLPDTFASISAAQQDPFADASLGNITGSNSVNVFLGLGLPWMIASIAWEAGGPTDEWTDRYQDIAKKHYPNAVFVVEAGNISYTVLVFTVTAIACFMILFARRFCLGGELGGPKGLQYASAFVLTALWFLYILLSIAKASDSAPR
eukprot:TRINITY_DN28621_c0_g1_i1.p1 TRINITY_DN28621_c0_g1~~TRINITY_DN28621_c0_g1_i1.p1  ORF type:complete len:826 (-),score=139.70 TRINITY_DN28621_c0_g1_i1:69-2546(-)